MERLRSCLAGNHLDNRPSDYVQIGAVNACNSCAIRFAQLVASCRVRWPSCEVNANRCNLRQISLRDICSYGDVRRGGSGVADEERVFQG